MASIPNELDKNNIIICSILRFLERKAFLERTDMRQFEIEKDMRNKERKFRDMNK